MNTNRPSWDSTFMTMAYLVGMRSVDQSSRIGAVAVDSSNSVRAVGYNGLPRGVDDYGDQGEDGLPARLSPIDGAKYQWTEHAERNAIYNAGRNETSLNGCTLYVNLLPCSDCARGIIQSGIKRVVTHEQGYLAFLKSRGEMPNIWSSDFEMVNDMLRAGGVESEWFNGPIVGVSAFFSGTHLDPAQFDITFEKLADQNNV